MGKITFNNGIKVSMFNLNEKDTIDLPNVIGNTSDSVIYSIAKDMYNFESGNLAAIYRSKSLSSNDFAIYRKSPNDEYKTYLGLVDNVTNGITDYGVASNKTYQYIIQPNPKDGNNISIQTEDIKVHWNCWSLVSLDYDLNKDIYIPQNTVFLFKNNLAVGSISDNMNFVKYNTLSKYGRVMQSEQKYDTGAVSCLFGDFQFVEENGKQQYKYYEDSEKWYAWKECIFDQKAKLLKSPNGDMWVVSISDQTSRDVNYNSSSYPTTISFNWQEIMDKDKVTIMKW